MRAPRACPGPSGWRSVPLPGDDAGVPDSPARRGWLCPRAVTLRLAPAFLPVTPPSRASVSSSAERTVCQCLHHRAVARTELRLEVLRLVDRKHCGALAVLTRGTGARQVVLTRPHLPCTRVSEAMAGGQVPRLRSGPGCPCPCPCHDFPVGPARSRLPSAASVCCSELVVWLMAEVETGMLLKTASL